MRNIIKASFIVGSGSAINILSSVIRYKYVAITLGPAGIGLAGILLTSIVLGGFIFSMGCDNSATRYIAQEKIKGDIERINAVHATRMAGIGLAGVSLIMLCLLSPILAKLLLNSCAQYKWILCLAVGIAATVLSASQIGILNGLNKLKHISTANIFGSLAGTIIGIIGIYFSKDLGLILMVTASPITICLFTWYYSRQACETKKIIFSSHEFQSLLPALKNIFSLGFIFASSILFTALIQFLTRVFILHKFGINDAGYFQAAWSISSTYLTLVLSALAYEYYPRISAIAHDNQQLNQQVNKQIEAVLLISVPLILCFILLSSLVIKILYTSSFSASIDILKWQLMGDIFKVVSWAGSFLLLAKAAKKKFLISELIAGLVYIISIYIFSMIWGLKATGLSYMLMYFIYLLVILYYVYAETRLKLTLYNTVLLIVFVIIALLITFSSSMPMLLQWCCWLLVFIITIFCYKKIYKEWKQAIH